MADKLVEVINIKELKIGDIICTKDSLLPMYVVGLFADDMFALTFQVNDHEGLVCADYADNPDEVFTFNLAIDNIYKFVSKVSMEFVN